MSIATEIAALAANKAAIKTAIEAKNPATAPTDALAQWPTAIASIPTGGVEEPPENDVMLIDYDGTILHSYTAQEALALTELPELPTHEGLTCQGWNYTLQQLKDNVNATGTCIAGAYYVPTDGKLHVFITIPTIEMATVDMRFGYQGPYGAPTATVDWGDGASSAVSFTSGDYTCSHTYSSVGSYEIKASLVGVQFMFVNGPMLSPTTGVNTSGGLSSTNGSEAYTARMSVIDKVYFPSSTYSIGACALYEANRMSAVVLPNVSSPMNYFGKNAFALCRSLRCVVFPPNCKQLSENILGQSGPRIVSFAPEMTEIPVGCFTQGSIAISSESIVSIPNRVTSIGNNAMQGRLVHKIRLPPSVTSIGNYVFANNRILNSIEIPSGVTTISDRSFSSCASLSKVTVLGDITKIGTAAFSNCYGLKILDLRRCSSVPVLGSTNAFDWDANLSIIVPDSLYESWRAATNWNNSSIVGKIVKASSSSLGELEA